MSKNTSKNTFEQHEKACLKQATVCMEELDRIQQHVIRCINMGLMPTSALQNMAEYVDNVQKLCAAFHALQNARHDFERKER